MRPPGARFARALPVLVVASLLLPACAPTIDPGTLQPTLTVEERPGGTLAFQNGIPVPTFDWQPRPRIELSGREWRVEREEFDSDLSLTDRDRSLEVIEALAGERVAPGFDDEGWQRLVVPSALNPPPDAPEIGGWYRRTFVIPPSWTDRTVTLKFGSANYIADVWVNGEWVGYHEGGYTPFAFDVSGLLRPGARNLLAVRVDNPPWGTRNDIVPWGLTDWWNYGGITGEVWLEATPPLHIARADVVPHLDAADVSVTVARAGAAEPEPAASVTAAPEPEQPEEPAEETEEELPPASVRVEVLPAQVTPANLDDRDVRQLVPDGARPIARARIELPNLAPGEVRTEDVAFTFGEADHWSPDLPALFVLHVRVTDGDGTSDDLWTTFGLRHVAVHPDQPRLLLNGEPVMLNGVGVHDEVIDPAPVEELVRGRQVDRVGPLLQSLQRARAVGANFLRAGHTPANPLLLMLADRLGFAVWEEIPLYHFTPLTFGIAMERGIPQQMLREMALRDFNRPSVLFHGLANESTGEEERTDALRALHDIDRAIDGTRLTGQAAYGSLPRDPTHEPLDVAGFTFYYGVFYGRDHPGTDTDRALRAAHETHPDKPILALEFGRWADGPGGEEEQRRIFEQTWPAFKRHSAENVDGYVAAATWWSLEDFLTAWPGIVVEHFGLYDAYHEPRPVADAVAQAFVGDAGRGAALGIESEASVVQVETAEESDDWRLVAYLGYAVAISLGLLGAVVVLLVLRGGRGYGGRPPARAS